MNELPLVSILINNYNYAPFLGDAIESALKQTYSRVEVIVVDDGSTDESRQIIASYGDQIKPILKENGGQASAFNLGFAASQGEIICLLDSDDIFLPTKVQRVIEILGNQQEMGWCFHPLQPVDIEKHSIPADDKYFAKEIKMVSSRQDVRLRIRRGKLGNQFIVPATSGLCFTRQLLNKILPMPETTGISLSDSYIKFIALGLSEGFILIDELALQRVHGNNLFTGQNADQKNAKIHIFTAYWMRVNFPELGKFANSFFVKGVGIFADLRIPISESDLGCQIFIRKYLEMTNFIDRMEIKSRLSYYRLKDFFKKFF